MPKGFFITLEGGEGSGKSTQIELLSEALQGQNYDLVTTREPGGTEEAEKIRDLVCDPKIGNNWSPKAEALLFTAARDHHLNQIIRPAIDAGKIVICDRYLDSTSVYQGMLQELDPHFLEVLEKAIDTLIPDLTFILDLPIKEGMARVKARGIQDHYDQQDSEFYEQVRQGFLTLGQKQADRCVIINANRPESEIHQEMVDIVRAKLDAKQYV